MATPHMNDAALKKFDGQTPPKAKGKSRKVIFHNLQDKDTKGNALPIQFSYNGVMYSLYSGKEYTLPEEVIQHLKNRRYPIYETRQDPDNQDNQVCVVTGWEPRFALYPADSELN